MAGSNSYNIVTARRELELVGASCTGYELDLAGPFLYLNLRDPFANQTDAKTKALRSAVKRLLNKLNTKNEIKLMDLSCVFRFLNLSERISRSVYFSMENKIEMIGIIDKIIYERFPSLHKHTDPPDMNYIEFWREAHRTGNSSLCRFLLSRSSPSDCYIAQEEIINHILYYLEQQINMLPTLKRVDAPQRRACDYFNWLLAQARAQRYVKLPRYYHATGKNPGSFNSILQMGFIKPMTPRTGTGGGAAWVSSQSLTEVNPYVFGFSEEIELFVRESNVAPHAVAIIGARLDIGFKNPIRFNGNGERDCLALIGMPADEVDRQLKLANTTGADDGPSTSAAKFVLRGFLRDYSESLRFYNARMRRDDFAIFSSETVIDIATAYNQIQEHTISRRIEAGFNP